MKKSALILTILSLLACNTAQAVQRSIPASKFLRSIPNKSLPQSPGASFYEVDSIALANELGSGAHVEITNFPGSYTDFVTLDLKPASSPIDSTTEFWEGTSSGAVRIVPPSFAVYRGTVLGEPNSKVLLTTFGGKLLVSIIRENGEMYEFGPAKKEEDPSTHIFIRQSDLFSFGEFHSFNCINEDISQPNAPLPVADLLSAYRSQTGPLGDTTHSRLLQLDLAVEADSCFYAAAGSNMNMVLGYIASLTAMSSTIYEDEVHITWHLTWVKVWPNNDPYNVKGNAYALEDTVPKYWRAHYQDVLRDCAHVMTSIGYGGGGYGYYSMCDPNWSYSMSSPQTGHQYPTFAFTYDAYIVAHEVGHTFSLVHTHQCYWDPPIDTCYTKDDTIWGLRLGDACDSLPVIPHSNPGSIMSYCANANYAIHHDSIQYFNLRMTFTPKVDSVLRANAENASCIVPPSTPTLILLSPRGSETYSGDSTIPIQWTSAHIDSIALQYSSDGGTFWTPIAESLPAITGTYSWKVPNLTSTKMLLRAIANSANGVLADTSLLFFTVTPSALITNPGSGERVSLSPDPAWSVLTVSGAKPGERIIYSIENSAGATVVSGESTVNSASEAHFSVGSLPSGTYYLEISSPFTRNLSFTHLK